MELTHFLPWMFGPVIKFQQVRKKKIMKQVPKQHSIWALLCPGWAHLGLSWVQLGPICECCLGNKGFGRFIFRLFFVYFSFQDSLFFH